MLPVGPWHCGPCREAHLRAGTRDITLHAPLMQLVFTGELPSSVPLEECPRLLEAAKRLQATDDGTLLVVAAKGTERVVLPICKRAGLIANHHQRVWGLLGETGCIRA